MPFTSTDISISLSNVPSTADALIGAACADALFIRRTGEVAGTVELLFAFDGALMVRVAAVVVRANTLKAARSVSTNGELSARIVNALVDIYQKGRSVSEIKFSRRP